MNICSAEEQSAAELTKMDVDTFASLVPVVCFDYRHTPCWTLATFSALQHVVPAGGRLCPCERPAGSVISPCTFRLQLIVVN